MRRLIAAMVVCIAAVLGFTLLASSSHAAANRKVDHTCSATDKQFVWTVASNMQQLEYWSRQLQSGSASNADVIGQARNESQQIESTSPTDPSLHAVRSLLTKMFSEYALAIRAKAHGGDAGKHMGAAYEDANYVHDVLVDAQPTLMAKGCDLTSLLQA